MRRAQRFIRPLKQVRSFSKVNTVVNFVPQQEEWMIQRFGKYNRTAKPGLEIVIPLIEKIAYVRSLKTDTIAISPQPAYTLDNVYVKLDGTVFYTVVDAYKSCYNINEPIDAITKKAQSVMRQEVGKCNLDQLFHNRSKIAGPIYEALKAECSSWGIEVHNYEIQNITPDAKTSEAMHLQSAAEREKRATITTSEGTRQAVINQSEGNKQKLINEATGEATHIQIVAEAHAGAIRTIAEALQTPGGHQAVQQKLATLYLEKYADVLRHSKTVIIPSSPGDISGVISTAMAVFKDVSAKA